MPNLLVASTEDIPLAEEDFLSTPLALTASSGTDPNFSWVGVLVSDHLRKWKVSVTYRMNTRYANNIMSLNATCFALLPPTT